MSDQIQPSETGFRIPLVRRFYPLPDAILFLYLLCIARQYLWALGGSVARNVIAWSVSTVLAGLIIWLLSSQRGTGWEGTVSTIEEGWHSWLSPESRQAGSFLARMRIDW